MNSCRGGSRKRQAEAQTVATRRLRGIFCRPPYNPAQKAPVCEHEDRGAHQHCRGRERGRPVSSDWRVSPSRTAAPTAIPGRDHLAVEPQDPGEQSAEAEVFIGPLNRPDHDRMEADPGCGPDAGPALRSRRPPDETHTVVGSSVAMTPSLRRSAENRWC
jgi:hypothetical protein